MSLARTTDHPRILETRALHWADEAACASWAQRLACQPGLQDALITLEGPLGAGKTTFVRYLLRALGVTGRIKSPTFAVLEPHRAGDLDISHFDFYRVEDPREWDDAGFRDVFARPGLKIVEWPDRVGERLPTPDLQVDIGVGDDDQRLVTLRARSARGAHWLSSLE